MKKEDLMPYLTSFITVELEDGSEHSGYISNPKDIEASENPETVRLLNGVYSEDIRISEIRKISKPDREDTVSIPVIDLKKGYEIKDEEDTDDLKIDEMMKGLFGKKKKD